MELFILKVVGLSNASLIDASIKKPILLLPTSYFTILVILKAHEEVIYAGIDITLNKMLNFVWTSNC